MKIGILECGEFPDRLKEKYGDYSKMFTSFLGSADPGLGLRAYHAFSGELPASTNEADGWLITGSRHGVYDPLPWIPELRDFLRACAGERRPIVGGCFGHQILAEALRGRVEKFAGGWGVGVQTYTSDARPAWMDGAGTSWSGFAFFQDQVVVQPPNSTIIATNDFCRIAALVYGDPEAPYAISVQTHPEFPVEFMVDLISERRGKSIPEDRAALALASLDQPVDNVLWARWITRFFHQAAHRRAHRRGPVQS